jgi:hypothetical protein
MITEPLTLIPSTARASWSAIARVRGGEWVIVEGSVRTTGSDALRDDLTRRLLGGGLARAAEAERRIAEQRVVPQGTLVCVIEEPPLVVCTRTEKDAVLVTAWLVSVFPRAASLPAVCCHEDELRERIA